MNAPQERQLVILGANDKHSVHLLKGITGKTVCGKKAKAKSGRVTFGPRERVTCTACKKVKVP